MVIFVLEASSVLRFLDNEVGSQRVSEALQAHSEGRARCIISSTHYGEIIGISYKRRGQAGAERIIARLDALKIGIVAPSAQRAVRSAILHVDLGIPFVDSFAVDLACDSPDHILLTADYDFKPAEHLIHIEFLPAKLKPKP